MQTFATPAPIAAVLDVPAGRIHVVATERADTTVEGRPADDTKSRDVTAAERTRIAYADGVLRVETTTQHQVLGSSGAVDVTIHLPAGSRIEARAASAEFRTTGQLGEVTFEGAHGAVDIDEAASVRLIANAADIAVARLTGPAEISTDQGDIRIAEAHRGTVVLRTQAGSITVVAAAGVAAALDAGTGHGRIDNSLKNDGAPALDIHATTSYGDIVARSL
ncbi:hypothetical protein GCM10010168_42420 [Actinoplanes ianthinogenes]|uniref:DUF4097 domain-containing protein n=2 Tax=Actinoplanes ianthinogenes TaxID=122358 RepID=A0ABM7LVV8_9ACTN|nr:DUF4097 family beta strand repeat-containing protein [Actinoplanes ianthinogenes]BCJ43448.1 hypothetical protein Aiant_41050 [Actinoplanes ianthinogenes]GGR20041.1 hypothetical protein GCM10010168_42420 [Actinoplanes ianthinogenes]